MKIPGVETADWPQSGAEGIHGAVSLLFHTSWWQCWIKSRDKFTPFYTLTDQRNKRTRLWHDKKKPSVFYFSFWFSNKGRCAWIMTRVTQLLSYDCVNYSCQRGLHTQRRYITLCELKTGIVESDNKTSVDHVSLKSCQLLQLNFAHWSRRNENISFSVFSLGFF